MNTRYDNAAAEARAHLKEIGQRDLAAAQQRYPVGTWVVAESDGLVRWGKVKGHKLNGFYKPLVEVAGTVFYAGEVARVIDEFEAGLLDAADKTFWNAAEAVQVIRDYWESQPADFDADCPGCSEPRNYCICGE